MKNEHTPSSGAIRAAKKLSPYKNEMEINAVALIIDEETSRDELLAALKGLVENTSTAPSTVEGVRRARSSVDAARAAIARAEAQ